MSIPLNPFREIALSRGEWVCGLICLSAIFIGLLARFTGLGAWCLAVDEFFIAKSVELILEKGFPLYPDGGAYSRALLFQYVEAASASVFGLNEYALRLPPVLFNLAGIPPLYWLAKKRIGISGALLLVAFFSISMWEVEFSRFARMYSMFQSAFIWFLYCYHEGFFLGRNRAIYCSYAIAGISVFIHGGSIFMALLLCLPVFFQGVGIKKQLWYATWASAILLWNVVSLKMWSWFPLGASGSNYPKGFSPYVRESGMLLLPDLSLWRSVFQQSGLWEGGYFMVALIGLGISYSVVVSPPWDWRQKAIGLLLLVCSLLQMYGVVFSLLLMAYLTQIMPLKWVTNELWAKRIGIFIISTCGFWVAFGLFTTSWQLLIQIQNFPLYKLLAILLHYPRIGEKFVFPWFEVMPYFLIASSLFGLITIWRLRNSQTFLRDSFLLLVLVSCLLALGVIDTRYSETRYSFFIFPVILLLWFEGAVALKSWIVSVLGLKAQLLRAYGLVAVFFPFGLLLTTEDFSFVRLMNMSAAEVNFRMNLPDHTANHYYLRHDFKTPAEYINERWKSGDVIINMTLPASFYLVSDSFVYYDQASLNFSDYAKRNGTRERWGFPLLYNKETVQSAVRSAKGTVWLLTTNEENNTSHFVLTNWVKDAFNSSTVDMEVVLPGIDKRIQVTRIVLQRNI